MMTKICSSMRPPTTLRAGEAKNPRHPKITKIQRRRKSLRIPPKKRETRSARRRRRTSVGMMIASEVGIKDTGISSIREVCSRVSLTMLKCMAISRIMETLLGVPSPTTWWKSSSSQAKEVAPPSSILPSMILICINLSSKMLSLKILELSLQWHLALDLTAASQVVNLGW